MKKFFMMFVAAVMCATMMTSCGYNDLVESQEKVEAQWVQVENVYQRRADLIPNLVNVVKGYAKHESSTLEAVINARANATSIKLDASNMTEEQLKRFQEAQSQFSGALSKLMAVSESYPDLKANSLFQDLSTQLEGTENRIATERKKFNDVAREYNTEVRSFPKNIMAMIFGFQTKPYFQAEAGANRAPNVSF